MKNWLKKNKYVIWYGLCFLLLGLIDQRRGSAAGTVQMIFSNLTGPVILLLLLPSMKREFFRWKGFWIWLGAALVLTPIASLAGLWYWPYFGQWCTAMVNVAVIALLVLYALKNRKALGIRQRLSLPLFFTALGALVLMLLSVHQSLWPLWFLCLFGCFYSIGIKEELRKSFFQGMLWGFMLWFFIQQSLAFGFRPYDFVRYRGLYSGETQNGLFYMMVFCAFLCYFMFLKEHRAPLWKRAVSFLLAAASVSFIFLTGGRSPLVGGAAAALVGLIAYDVIFRGSLKHWLVQGIGLGLCVLLLLPAAYGSVRFFPVILHHPVWFEGEYRPETSVHSYDPWNSWRYISFEEMLQNNVGRILQMFGIDLSTEEGKLEVSTALTLRARAAEDPGSSPEHPFFLEGTDMDSSISIRKTIYAYYLSHLNLQGHGKEEAGMYMTEELYYGHAHNMFLQIAYDYGIPAGILFLLLNLFVLVRLLFRRDREGIFGAVFLTAILVYGCTEMTVVTGQITLVMLFILYYFGMEKLQNGKASE